MKTQLFFLFFLSLLLFPFQVEAQKTIRKTKTTTTTPYYASNYRYIKEWNVYTVGEEEFNQRGQKIKESLYKPENNYLRSVAYKYDSHNNLIEEHTTTNTGGDFRIEYKRKYEGDKCIEIVEYEDGVSYLKKVLVEKNKYKEVWKHYGSTGRFNVIETITFHEGKHKERIFDYVENDNLKEIKWTYNSDGKEVSEERIKLDGTTELQYLYDYSTDGLERTYYSDPNNKSEYVFEVFDSKGSVVYRKSRDSNNRSISVTSYNIEYDQHGNWKDKQSFYRMKVNDGTITKDDLRASVKEERVIEYY